MQTEWKEISRFGKIKSHVVNKFNRILDCRFEALGRFAILASPANQELRVPDLTQASSSSEYSLHTLSYVSHHSHRLL